MTPLERETLKTAVEKQRNNEVVREITWSEHAQCRLRF